MTENNINIVLAILGAIVALLAVRYGQYLTDFNRKKSASQLEEAIYSHLDLVKSYFSEVLPDFIDCFNNPYRRNYSKVEDISLRYVDALYLEVLRYGGQLSIDQVRGLHNLQVVLSGIYLQQRELDGAAVLGAAGLILSKPIIALCITQIVDFIYLVEKFTILRSDFNFDAIEVDGRRFKKVLGYYLEGDELEALVRDLENHIKRSGLSNK